MESGDVLSRMRSHRDALRELNGTKEEYDERARILKESDNLIESLSALLGIEIQPILRTTAQNGNEFAGSMLFSVDNKYIFYYRTHETYDGYDMWNVSMPVLRPEELWKDPWGKISLTDWNIAFDFTTLESTDRTEGPLERSELVEKIENISDRVRSRYTLTVDEKVGDETFLDLCIAQFENVASKDYRGYEIIDYRVQPAQG